MKKTFFIGMCIVQIFIGAVEQYNVKRFALLIGANNGGNSRKILRYAESDAKMISNVFLDIGGVDKKNSILLLGATKNSIKRSFVKITKEISNVPKTTRTELIFYYSGHSDETGLLVKGGHITYKELKNTLEKTNANVKIGILDSCSSGTFTKLKGGKHVAPFLIDNSIKTLGHAYITSSSENEAAQESGILKASFFTHYLVSALRGAGDSSRDGIVSLHEAYSYASNATLARTESTESGSQHAAYDFKLSGSGDIVLTDLRNAESSIVFSKEEVGTFFIRDSKDNLISEVTKHRGTPVTISLPAGRYSIVKEKDSNFYKQNIKITKGEVKKILLADYKNVNSEKNTARGNEETEDISNVDIVESLGILGWNEYDKCRDVGFGIGILEKGKTLKGVQIAFFGNGIIHGGSGLQLSLLFNGVGGDFGGVQNSQIFNLANNISGIQAATAVNIASNVTGFQLSVALNMANNLTGTQVTTGVNIANDVEGVQVTTGVNIANDVIGTQVTTGVNIANDVTGVQFGLVNIGHDMNGVQLGLVNISNSINGVPIGLVNITKNGFNNFRYKFDINHQEHYFEYQSGASCFYSILSLVLPKNLLKIDEFSLGGGFGVNLVFGKLYTEIEGQIFSKFLVKDIFSMKQMYSYPLVNIKVGYLLWGKTSVFTGASLGLPRISTQDKISEYKDYEVSFFLGLRL